MPLLILAFLGLVGAAFIWLAYGQVQSALRANGIERLTGAARQVADLLGRSAHARIAEAQKLADDPDGWLPPAAAGSAPPAAQAFVSKYPVTSLWLFDSSGGLLGLVEAGHESPGVAPVAAPPPGVSTLFSGQGRVWYYTTVPISKNRIRTGQLSIQRSLGSAQAADIIARLIGSDAELKFGNATGDLWTDLSAPTEAPPIGFSPEHGGHYHRANGEGWIGVTVPVPETPWLIWVAVPEATMLAPATSLIRRMVPVTVLLIVVGVAVVSIVTRHLTRPLEGMADVAAAIADGDYTRRVATTRRDEIGRLASTLNLMVERVETSQRTLEERVELRTVELQAARQELDRFFSLSLDLLCIAGMDGRFRRVNPAWEQVLGWTSEELVAVPYVEFVHPEDREKTGHETEELVGGTTTVSFENRYRCKDGSYKWLSWKAVPLIQDGIIYGVARDVTERRQSEAALQRYAAQMQAANEELEAFSYSVSHDLRAPLRHVAGFAALLDKHSSAQLDETGKRYVATIEQAARHMGRLVDDLLAFSRMGRAEMMELPVDLEPMIHELIAEITPRPPERHVVWTVHPLPRVRGDRSMLRLAFSNLLQNAHKYTSRREVAEIEVGTAPATEGQHVLYVKDNGVGFDMVYVEKLFGVFQRLHNVEEFEGIGIGLANVRRIVQRHGGRVWAEGTVQMGATFYVALPAEQSEMEFA